MRDVFGKTAPEKEQLEELADDPEFDAPTLIDMLKGVAAANFDSLTGWSGKISKALADRMSLEMKQAMDASLGDPTPTSSPTASAENQPTEETVSAA